MVMILAYHEEQLNQQTTEDVNGYNLEEKDDREGNIWEFSRR